VHKTLDLNITVYAAQNMPLPPDATAKSFRPYIKIELHVEEAAERRYGVAAAAAAVAGAAPDPKEKAGEYKVRTTTAKGPDPDFGPEGMTLVFKGVPGVVEELTFVRFTVRDDQLGRDALAAWACVRLDRLRHGYRFVHLLDANGIETDSVILVKIAKKTA
jgi:hypothetical protein